MDKIIIRNLNIYAYHGVFEEENIKGQPFIVSAVMHTNTRRAGLTDELTLSTHYGEVSHFINSFMKEHTFKLIETVAERLAEEILLNYPLIEKIDLEISKPEAPIGLDFETVAVQITRGWHRAYIALGSNMGDKRAYLDGAVKALDERRDCQVVRVADYIETEPYGGVEQDSFLNSALELRTLLSPEELLAGLHEIEAAAGRERLVHWGPRTLDLDILFYDDLVIDTEALHIPHIDLHNRDFVLSPMQQIAPFLRHPVLNKTIGELWGRG